MLATLSSLRIRNLALVEELNWQLGRGFTAITGETGSGKSIIVGALNLVLGERAEKTLIRTGAESCTVEASFEVGDASVLNARLEQQGVDPCQEGQLIVRRVFSTTGHNRQFINGSATTLAALKDLGDALVDLHGPHDHQSLLSTERQLALLDSFAGAEDLAASCAEQYRRLQQLIASRDELTTNEAALERETSLLRHQVNEVEAAQLREDEEAELLARYTVVTNSRRLLEISNQILSRLAESENAALVRLSEAGKLLRELERLDPAVARFSESHLRAVTELDDLATSLRAYAQDVEVEPGDLAQVEERVTLLETLKRKYGGSIPEVLAFTQNAAERLRKIESRAEEVARLDREIESLRDALGQTARYLRQKRKAAAPKLAGSVTFHLRDLGFSKSEFMIALRPMEKVGGHGIESAEFLFAPNAGEPAKPLKAIASSGEISRVMLAVKSSLAVQDTIAVLVFDEIDANVGGEIAHAVGTKMQALAERHQVLCISHLPQVAALADTQFVVTKEFASGRTVSQLRKVEGKARVEEIARMLGGQTESAVAHARTLLGPDKQ